MHLTDLTIKNLPVPERGQKAYYDDQIHGLSCRVSQGGKKSWSLVYGNPRKRVSLGAYPFITLKQARERASKLIAHRMLHGDAPPDLTLNEAFTLYFKLHCQEHTRPSTQRETDRFFQKYWLPKLGKKNLRAITTADILEVTDSLAKTPTERNHTHAAMRGLLRFAVRRRYVPHSVMEGLQKPAHETPRSRVLSPAEICVVYRESRHFGLYGQLLRLLLLTGQRLGQFKCLKREWIGKDTIHWPGKYMKSNKDHLIPIGPLTQAELKNFPLPFHFNNYVYAHKRFLRDTTLEHFTRHDCRRTYATIMAQWTPPHVLERLLAHTKGQISGVSLVYNRHAYLSEMRDCALRFERWITTLR